MVENAYIHIPFCKSKCHYCSFVSFDKLGLKKEYLEALKFEINNKYKNELLKTLYFGGGTPSLLTIDEFQDIIDKFNVSPDAEITAELNPENVSKSYFHGLKNAGINRISLGCQTFNDEILQQINRRHNSAQVINSVKLAQHAGFNNISLDLIYGLPNQTINMFLNDIKSAINLGIQHISFYGLAIEEDCYFHKNFPKNLPDDDTQTQMYLKGVQYLMENGFEHYEISNFSLPKFYSKHNLNYWDNNEYYGFGTAAHGYLDGIRYGNVETIEEYIKNPLNSTVERIEDDKDKLEEEIFLGFRKMKGIDVKSINSKYNVDFEKLYSKILEKYLNLNFIEKTDNGYKLTLNGVLVSNTILSDFIFD